MYRFLIMLMILASVVQANVVENALDKAADLALAESRYWHLLLHMPKDVSEVDDPAFFLAPDGRENAGAELNATITALYGETRFDDNATGCRFPARRAWLQERLGLEGLPALQCTAYETLVRKMDPQSVTLVFSSAHINSPASMFGHTFLRIDSSYESKMLSYAVNYAAGADPDKENGIVFAIKGLFGGYPGFYSLLPYYEKLKEYRDTEQRDVWEYDLDLNHDEVMAMIRHIWELKGVYNWYYFFDENCSYNMLWLMEIARPDVDVRGHFIYHIIPMETVHATEEEGLVHAKHYRPSKRTLLLAYERVLDKRGETEALALADGVLEPREVLDDPVRDAQMKRYTLEAASELAEYRLMKGKVDKAAYSERFHKILSARAALGKGETLPVTRPRNPDEGHRATRALAATGWRDGNPYQRIGIRPAYHDLSDSDVGFMPGTQIEFLDLEARYDRDGAAVEKATIVSITSIAPQSAFFSPFSWRMRAGWDQSFLSRDAVFGTTVGAGFAAGGRWGYGYLLAEPEIFITDKGYGAFNTTAGVLFETGGGSKLAGEGGYRFYADGMRQWTGRVEHTSRISQNNALKLFFDYTEKTDGPQRSFSAAFVHYY
ncbi:DUF4105 domain-containing protein [Sulfurimonas sp. HSL1-2]|uniref:Lnb N-terminal periplasmic domain-containing protein n=1 Tax=Thiomicrolovo zhangzhouensis TaxID=3131933 RepID=UPI0031F8806C